MILKGNTIKLGDDINTDLIISGRYKFSISDIKELAKHIFEDIDPNFYQRIETGRTIIVGGKNFGMGSSREQAPLVIKQSGIVCVVAKSFARIFYRNAINIGLPLIEADSTRIKEKDELSIDSAKGVLENLSQKYKINVLPLPGVMQCRAPRRLAGLFWPPRELPRGVPPRAHAHARRIPGGPPLQSAQASSQRNGLGMPPSAFWIRSGSGRHCHGRPL